MPDIYPPKFQKEILAGWIFQTTIPLFCSRIAENLDPSANLLCFRALSFKVSRSSCHLGPEKIPLSPKTISKN